MLLPRKFTVLAATMLATALAGFGLSASASQGFGQDEEKSELHKIMESVQKHNATVLKGVRTPALFKKSQDDIVKAAKELAKLGKDAKPHNEIATEKKAVESWDKMMDSFIEEATTFASEAEKKDAQQSAVKASYKKVQATCTACHDDFRPED